MAANTECHYVLNQSTLAPCFSANKESIGNEVSSYLGCGLAATRSTANWSTGLSTRWVSVCLPLYLSVYL